MKNAYIGNTKIFNMISGGVFIYSFFIFLFLVLVPEPVLDTIFVNELIDNLRPILGLLETIEHRSHLGIRGQIAVIITLVMTIPLFIAVIFSGMIQASSGPKFWKMFFVSFVLISMPCYFFFSNSSDSNFVGPYGRSMKMMINSELYFPLLVSFGVFGFVLFLTINLLGWKIIFKRFFMIQNK